MLQSRTQALTLPLLSLPQHPLPHSLIAPTVSVPSPTPSWKGVHGGHFRCQDTEGLCCAGVLTGKLLCFSLLFILCLLGPPLLRAGWLQGFWCLYTAVKGHLEGAGCEEVLSGVCTYMGGGGGHGEVGLGSQPSLQEAGSWGPREELPETQGPHCLLYWPWGTLHKETAPSLLAPTSSRARGTGVGRGGSGVRAGPALAMLRGHTKESRGRHWGRAGGLGKLALLILYPHWGWGPLPQL